MNSAVAQRQPAGTMAIVPGDRIAVNRVEKFTEEQLLEAFDKRFRGEPEIDGDIFDQAMAMTKLADAVEFLKDHLVKVQGDDRNVILTAEELRQRGIRQQAEGVMNALMAELAKGATENDLKRVVRQQVSMRKIPRDPDTVGSALVRNLKYHGYVFIRGYGDNMQFGLVNNKKLPVEQYCEFYKQTLNLE